MIEAQKESRKKSTESSAQNPDKPNSSDDDDISYATPQTFLKQLFKLYDEGLVDYDNIRDQVFLMVHP